MAIRLIGNKRGKEIMFKRLSEAFVDKMFSDDYEVVKHYKNGSLMSIEILPNDGNKSIYIWNKYLVDVEPYDSDLSCELEMSILEERLAEPDGISDMKELIEYFLSPEYIQCLCVDYGGFKGYEEINYGTETVEEIITKHIRPALEDIGALTKEDNDTLASAIEAALFLDKKVDICDATLYYDTILKSEYEEMSEC